MTVRKSVSEVDGAFWLFLCFLATAGSTLSFWSGGSMVWLGVILGSAGLGFFVRGVTYFVPNGTERLLGSLERMSTAVRWLFSTESPKRWQFFALIAFILLVLWSIRPEPLFYK